MTSTKTNMNFSGTSVTNLFLENMLSTLEETSIEKIDSGDSFVVVTFDVDGVQLEIVEELTDLGLKFLRLSHNAQVERNIEWSPRRYFKLPEPNNVN